MSLRVEIVKLSDERHRLGLCRSDGSVEAVELETRSLLLHDFAHWAVEAEVPIEDGFFGLVARGVSLGELAERGMADPLSPGLALAERLVGPFQALWNGRLEAAVYLTHARGVGPHLDEAWIARVSERLRRLTGAWRAVPFAGALELAWPPAADPVVVGRR